MEDDLAGRGAAQPFVAQGRACDVATEAFEGLPLMAYALREARRKPCQRKDCAADTLMPSTGAT